MTLVRNLLQLLNGSKIRLLAISLLWCASSCGNLQKTQETEVVDVVIPEKVKEEVEEEVVEEIIEKQEDQDIEIIQDAYNIAILLPFELDDAPQSLDYTRPGDDLFKSSSKMALEFYHGLSIAIDRLKNTKFEANIYILDSENSSSQVKRLLGNPPFSKLDLIIGPIYNTPLREVAKYAKNKKTPMISPFSSATNITSENSYYYSANATANDHYAALFKHITSDFEAEELYIFHQNTDIEQDIISQFESFNAKLDTTQRLDIINYEMTTDQKTHDLNTMMDSLETSLVLIPSYSETFTEYALNQLAQIAHHRKSIVFGMPKWLEFRNVNFDYMEWMTVHITASYFSEEKDRAHVMLTNKFREKYGYDPTKYAKQAYDLIMFLSNNFTASRRKGEILLKNADFNGIQTNFEFGPIYSNEGKIDFISNKFVHILEFEDFQFKKVKE